MAKKFFVNLFFNIANVDFFTLHALFFDVAYAIFKCFRKNYMLHATFTHVVAGMFTAYYRPILGPDIGRPVTRSAQKNAAITSTSCSYFGPIWGAFGSLCFSQKFQKPKAPLNGFATPRSKT